MKITSLKKIAYRKAIALAVLGSLMAGMIGLKFTWDRPTHRPLPYIDFDLSMRLAESPETPKLGWGPQIYPMLKQLYEKNFYVAPADAPYKIPKVMHQIWLGSPFPEKYKAFRDSWLKHHPDWEYKLWTEKELNELGLINQEQYDYAINYGEKSDIAKYELIYRFGGVYLDTDYECLAPIDTLHQSYDFYIGIQPLDTQYVQIGLGLFGARPGHPILQAVVEDIGKKKGAVEPVVSRTGPLYFTPIFYYLAPQCADRVIALPATYLYPMGYNEKTYDQEKWRRPESLAVHHWEGSWLKPEAFEKR